MYFFAENVTFDAYIPFLQIAIGFNLILGAWDRIYDSLEKSLQKLQVSDDNLVATLEANTERRQELDAKRNACEECRKIYRRLGLWLGVAISAIAALTLLFVPMDVPVTGWGFTGIAASGFTMPFLMGVMYITGIWCHFRATSLASTIAREAAAAKTTVRKEAEDAAQDIPSENNSNERQKRSSYWVQSRK